MVRPWPGPHPPGLSLTQLPHVSPLWFFLIESTQETNSMLRHPQLGETFCGPDRDPFPHREWGRFPASWGPTASRGSLPCDPKPKRVGKLNRENCQGQLNLAHPTGIRAEALSLWLKGPLPGRGVKHRGRPGSCLQPVAALPPVYTGVPPPKGRFWAPQNAARTHSGLISVSGV